MKGLIAPLILCLLSACASAPRPVVVVTGYWPPTNEMLRPWSTDPALNPAGWQGENWRGLGFDVYAFFPEFPPDGDPTNDQIGEVGSVGAESSDLRVDYQDTSADFWRIVDALSPVVVVTTSRGGRIAWELEAIEGGHDGGSGVASDDWVSDRSGVPLPLQESVDPRSWAAIEQYRAGRTLSSNLPLERMLALTRERGGEIDRATSGNYLSGFMGLHGLYYRDTHPHALMAGHIHVGRDVEVEEARSLFELSLEGVLQAVQAQHPD